MFKKLAIVVCVSILLAAVFYQVYQSLDLQTDYNQKMDSQRLQIEAQRRELQQDLAEVQAKEELSDHDRWLIDHLSKSIEGIDKAIVTIETGQQRVERHYLRKWGGIAGALLALAGFGLVSIRNTEGKLSAQEDQLLQQPLHTVSGLSFDTNSYRSDPAPVSGGANFVTGRIRQQSPSVLKIRGGKIIKAIATVFLVGPIISLAVDSGYLINDILNRGWDAEFSMISNSLVMLAGFGLGTILMLATRGNNVTVNREHQVFRFQGEADQIPFRDIASLQLNSLLVTGNHTFHNHQIQLNLKNGQSRSLLSHAGEDQMTVDLILLARFTGLPVAVPA